MERQILSPQEIQQYVQVRVNQLREVQEDDAHVSVPLPEPRSAGIDGCNWTMQIPGEEKAYRLDIRYIVEEAQKRVNLP
ncbi:hypothetical protein SAMN06265795_11361 [Noviherbaspirillum humi]|uniref:Uncharacterized protein n=1 Tax=Noviherbaspirillum humi TaxID=1688639 RepID=A0A239JTH7_9BURK|nr:hypothetical protein [Noviherbaspirillum humi]SNT08164.1 hypothetical protein SAMN06265795_11361 [Noviherbaspirillum humi]